jgi:hypothetical protein
VLKYLEGLEPGDPIPEDWERASSVNVRAAWAKSPPKSPVPLLHSPSPKASGDGTPQHLQRLADSVVSYSDVHKQHDDDVDSNVQDGQRSGLASLRGYGRVRSTPVWPTEMIALVTMVSHSVNLVLKIHLDRDTSHSILDHLLVIKALSPVSVLSRYSWAVLQVVMTVDKQNIKPTWNLEDAQGSNPASPRSQNPVSFPAS